MNDLLVAKIQAMRTERNMTKKEFAALVGVHPAIISHIENRERPPSTRVAMKLANVLGIGSDELLEILSDSKAEREAV